MTGFSLAGVLADGSASPSHTEQYYEMSGHRAYRRDDLESVTLHYPHTSFDDERWYLYNIAEDPTQTRDVAATNPEQLAALVSAWDEAAWENQVYPIDDGSAMALLTRPDGRQPRAITLYPGMPTLERHRALGLIINRSFQVSASFEQPPGGTGMLFAHGDQGGGYCLYIDDAGQLTYAHNAFGAMTVLTARFVPPGPHEAVLDVDSPQFGVWNLRILVDGEAVAGADMLEAPTSIAPFEGIDIGIDRRSPVNWDVYNRHGPFPYSGKIRWVRYEPGALVPGPGRSGEEVHRELQKYQ
jgi:arylsulfatase